MTEKIAKSLPEMVGEMLRETGVLIGVFGSLYAIYEGKTAISPMSQIAGWLSFSALFLLSGIILERTRK